MTIRQLDLEFDASQVTNGTTQQQADQAVQLINLVLEREPSGLNAQLIWRTNIH